MTTQRISPEDRIVGLLSKSLTDYANRGLQWIFPFRPNIKDILAYPDRFPLVSVEAKTTTTRSQIGIGDSAVEETINFYFDIYVRAKEILTIDNYTCTYLYNPETPLYSLETIPISKIYSVTGVVNGEPYMFLDNDYMLVDSDQDGYYDHITFMGSAAPDVESLFVVTSSYMASEGELARIIAQDINDCLRDRWMTDLVPYLFDFRKVGSTPIPFEMEMGLYRHELQVSFNGINIGDRT